MEKEINSKPTIEIAIRLAFLAFIVAWCLMIVYPFMGVLMWGVILALVFNPLHTTIARRTGGRKKLASVCVILLGLAILLVPAWLFTESLVQGAKDLATYFKAGTLTIPPPSEKVNSWPIIGHQLYKFWSSASTNLGQFIVKYQSQFTVFGKAIFKEISGIGQSALQFIIAIFIAGAMLTVKGIGDSSKKFFRRLMGGQGDEIAGMVQKTVNNVVKGVIGLSLIQSVLAGIGFLLAGVPYAGIWALVMLILAILQLPGVILILPIIIYLFSTLSALPAVLWSLYLLAVGVFVNILQPLVFGKGTSVPMLVIFVGVIGGFMLSGFIGLFTGAIVLSVGYKLFTAWMNPGQADLESNPQEK